MDLHIVTDNRLSLKLMSSRNSFEANYCYFDYIISQGIRVRSGEEKRKEAEGGGYRLRDRTRVVFDARGKTREGV